MTFFLVAYIAGIMTIISPCILPILPFIFARSDVPFVKGTLPMLAGMAMTFAGVATLAAVGGSWAVEANQYGRAVALAFLALFGLTLVSQSAATLFAQPLVALGNWFLQKVGVGAPGVGASVLIGGATGLLWAPCAGPILGLVLTGAALNGANVGTTLLLAAYAAGATTSLAVASIAGARLFDRLRRSIKVGSRVRQCLGVAVLGGVLVIGSGIDTSILARMSYASTSWLEQSLLEHFQGELPDMSASAEPSPMPPVVPSTTNARLESLPVEGLFPPLDGAVSWLNSEPLSVADLRGKVVLVDFWTYSCINCIRSLPYVRAWSEKYKDQGLVVIGVHSPEFAFEKDIDNVKSAIKRFEIGFPVAIDNDFSIWRAFRNSYWPALYFIDAQGRIRHHRFGEGDYVRSEEVIKKLLKDAKLKAALGNGAHPKSLDFRDVEDNGKL